MKELTRAEEQVMQVLWDLERAFVREILDQLPEPKPAYNTVSTIVRILEKKQFVSHEEMGKAHRYYPLITRYEYKKFATDNLLSGYFGGSAKQMLSFFMKEKELDIKELDQILKTIRDGDD